MNRIGEIKVAIGQLEQIGHQANEIARNHGKKAEIKRPILVTHMTLVIRNIDENSRDEAGSVNSMQVAMKIAVLASKRGMDSFNYISSGNLHIQINNVQKVKRNSWLDLLKRGLNLFNKEQS